MYKKFLSIAVMFALILTFVPQYSFSQVIKVNPKLEEAIKEKTGIEELTIEELENLDYLWLNRWDENDTEINSLEGIELAKNLKYLDVTGHPISDLKPLENLSLEKVSLGNTQVSDLSPLKNWKVTYSVYFYFPNNQFTSLKGIENIKLDASVKSIGYLNFPSNNLTNINELSVWNNHSFEVIEEVDFRNNKLTDISPLTNLKVTDRVYRIDLANNNITDITPLEKFVDKKIEYINVENNPLNAESLQLLYHLQANGTMVYFGDKWNPSKTLKKWEEKDSEYSNQNKTDVVLDHQFKVKFNDEVDLSLLLKSNDVQVRDSAFKLVNTTFELLDSNTLVIKPKEKYEQRSVYSIYISGNVKSTNGTRITEPIFYSFKTKDLTPTVIFKDSDFEERISRKLKKQPNERITEGDMQDITHLSIYGDEGKNFTGLEKATNLEALNIGSLGDTEIQAIKSIILNLPSLKRVYMSEDEQDTSFRKALQDKGIEVKDSFY